ncbi:Gfo/Idh/MocA family oxidoreductase [Verrucomicrobia bacterium]|nr:Gfo/Idh/MocA family oxidoreductase [Verrucomicrobiota bacterium]
MKKPITRRKFVSTTAATAFAFNFFPSRVFGANDRILLGGIGVGGKGRGEINDNSKAGAEIVALCDVDDNRAAETFKKFPKAKRYKDFRVMLEKQKDIDAVTVSTPDHTHAVAAVMAMKMGKHCYCQKPLTHSVYEARVMTEVAREKGVVTQMGNQAHSGEPIRRAVELIQAGIIGDVTEAHMWTNRPVWPQGVNRPAGDHKAPDTLDWDLFLGPAPWRPYHPDYAPFKWRGYWDFGTGALGDMACHIMDMAYWSLELGAPDWVQAEQQGMTQESAPTSSIVTYQFPKRGKKPPVKFVWYDGKNNGKQNYPPAEVVDGEDISKYGTVLVGKKGTMFFNRSRTNWLIKANGVMANTTDIPKTIPRVKNEDQEWLDGIRNGNPDQPLSNFSRSGPFSEVVLLGNVAIRSGKKIEWDSKNLRVTNAPEANQYIRREYRKGWSL